MMKWYHIYELLKYSANPGYREDLPDPDDELIAARRYAYDIERLASSSLKNETLEEMKDTLEDIMYKARDIMSLSSDGFDKLISFQNELLEFTKDSLENNLDTVRKYNLLKGDLERFGIRKERLTEDTQRADEDEKVVLSVWKKDTILSRIEDIDSNFEWSESPCQLHHLPIWAGWGEEDRKRIFSLLPNINLKVSKLGTSLEGIRYHNEAVCGRTSISFYGQYFEVNFGMETLVVYNRGNIQLRGRDYNTGKRESRNYNIKALEDYFLSPFFPTEAECCAYSMVNPEGLDKELLMRIFTGLSKAVWKYK